MKTAAHKLSGVAAAAFFYWAATKIDFPQAPHLSVGVLLGCTAPDWLEIPRWEKSGKRKSVIPHRQTTHWLMGWSFLLGFLATFAVLMTQINQAKFVLVGFATGGLIHALMDAPTPMGVPEILPVRIRKRKKPRAKMKRGR